MIKSVWWMPRIGLKADTGIEWSTTVKAGLPISKRWLHGVNENSDKDNISDRRL
jgi:hypothetical protein